MFLHLKIVKENDYNEYVLKNNKDNKEYKLILEFYGIDKPKVGDVIIISDKLIEPNNEWYSQPYVFELSSKVDKNIEKINLLGLISQGKKYILKRIYG